MEMGSASGDGLCQIKEVEMYIKGRGDVHLFPDCV
jgi:hypothetical protein